MHGGRGGKTNILNTAVDGSELSASRLNRFTPKNGTPSGTNLGRTLSGPHSWSRLGDENIYHPLKYFHCFRTPGSNIVRQDID
jgi:hypothetical protein